MLSSIGGQNERWAQIAALQPPRPAQPGRDGGLDLGGVGLGNAGTTTTDLPPISPIAGSTSSPLANDTNFLLSVFGGSGHLNPVGSTGPAARAAQLATIGQTQRQVPAGSGAANPTGAAADGITGTSLVQELQALVSPGATVTFASGGVAPPSVSRVGSDTRGDAIGNGDTAAPSWRNGWDSPQGISDGRRQQLGLAAYGSSDLVGETSSTTSVLQGLTA